MKKYLVALTVILLALSLAVPIWAAPSRKLVTAPPEIERGVFVDYGYSSPPWYPPEEETDSYRWAPKLHWASTDLPLDVTVYIENAPVGAFVAVSPAFGEWDGNTSTDLYDTVSEDTTTSSPGAVLNNENTMSWGTIDGPGGIIGVCYYWYYSNTKELVEFDIILDKDDPWGVGESNKFDIQNVATHELGHTLALQDLRSPKDGALTMHAYTWLGDDIKRTLGLGDISGVQAIYGE